MNFEEFTRVYLPLYYTQNQRKAYYESFKQFDTSDDGKISLDELKVILTKKGSDPFSEEECNDLMANLDYDGDGFISYSGMFITFFATLCSYLI